MNKLPAKRDMKEVAVAVGLEPDSFFYTAYRMLAAGQHPLAVYEKIINLGGNVPLDALAQLRQMIPEAEERASSVFPHEIITDPLDTYHRAFQLQKERLQELIAEEQNEGKRTGAVDAAILELQESAAKLATLMKSMGYNPYANERQQRRDTNAVLLSVIMKADKDTLRQLIISDDFIDGEVTEL